jgi:hypothetical protein
LTEPQSAIQILADTISGKYTLNRGYYEDMAWGGLTNTPAFISKTTDEKTRILDVIQTEQYKQDRLANPTTPKGTPAGC